MMDDVVMDQLILFLKPNNWVRFRVRIRWSIHHIILQTKQLSNSLDINIKRFGIIVEIMGR